MKTPKMIQIDPGCYTQPSNVVSVVAEPAFPGLAPEYSRPARVLVRLSETTGEWTTRVIHCATFDEAKTKAEAIVEQINA
jgi:hypothetical protein